TSSSRGTARTLPSGLCSIQHCEPARGRWNGPSPSTAASSRGACAGSPPPASASSIGGMSSRRRSMDSTRGLLFPTVVSPPPALPRFENGDEHAYANQHYQQAGDKESRAPGVRLEWRKNRPLALAGSACGHAEGRREMSLLPRQPIGQQISNFAGGPETVPGI